MKTERSAEIHRTFPGLQFAVIDNVVIDPAFAQHAGALSTDGAITGDGAGIEAAIAATDDFFKAGGFTCPLPGQFASTRKKGLPPVPPLVRALLYAEMTTGVLMGVQDGDRVYDHLLLDLAQDDETFQGMRGEVVCRAGEPVVRDARGIIASLFQGPDQRTRVEAGTTNPVFLAFGVPGLPDGRIATAVATVEALFPGGTAVSYA